MNFYDELTLLSKEELDEETGLDPLRIFNSKNFGMTDLALITRGERGVIKNQNNEFVPAVIYTKSVGSSKFRILTKHYISGFFSSDPNTNYETITPVLNSPYLFDQLIKNKYSLWGTDLEVVKYGEYPQFAPGMRIQENLNEQYKNNRLKETGKKYHFLDDLYKEYSCEEYKYNGKKYIRIMSSFPVTLTNNTDYRQGHYVWLEVKPVEWLIDYKTKKLISRLGLLSGIKFTGRKEYDGNFEGTDLYKFLNNTMIKDLTQGENLDIELNDTDVSNTKNEINPYGFEFDKVSEEDIIKGAIESGIAVFLHGKSSEGKSARVKEIDPDCEIIYLRNSTPDSLNGKSVYNQETGEMINIPPTWLNKLKEKCEEQPDKLHIVFFDEITNALPSIQGMAFNIILDREVNGIWKLPENARIVAAGNEMSDSLAANQMAEPLFNRFAHVYIKTTLESWLKWASTHNIHPAIYSFIAYKKGAPLRSNYDGEHPNADPRKWEMASNMLYKTGNPEMLRALVGEEITKEFIQFCKQRVITLEDVIKGNYTKEEIDNLNTGEKYATAIALTQAKVENIETIRNFVKELGAEFTSLFDLMWAGNDLEKLEILSEIRLPDKDNEKKKI